MTIDLNIKSFNQYLQSLDFNMAQDLSQINRSSDFLLLNDKTKNIECLLEFENLKTLYFIGANNDALKLISDIKWLLNLQLTYLKTTNLSEFKTNKNIQILVIEDCRKITSLAGIEKFQNLKMLSIGNSKKITDLNEMQYLSELVSFNISGGNLEKTKINSLDPLSKLMKLERIQISTVKILDERLDKLENLINLKELHLPNYFPTEEYAKLSIKLPNTSCSLFYPYTDCGSLGYMVTGKGKHFLDPEKEKKRIEKYVIEFEKIKSEVYKSK